MKIYEALKKDHQHTKKLLSKLVSKGLSADQRTALINEIRDDIIPHSRAEETVFYNPLRELDIDTSKVMHGYKEHMEAETLLRALQVEDKLNITWEATAKKLKKNLEHHIKEEESKIFAVARRHYSDEEAEQIGLAFMQMKPEIKNEGILQTTLDMVTNLMPPRLSKALGVGKPIPSVGA